MQSFVTLPGGWLLFCLATNPWVKLRHDASLQLQLNINNMEYGGCVYIMANFHNTVLYIGVTSNLPNRIYQHRTKEFKTSFTARYNCDKLVWYECFSRIEDAIAREKQLKAGNRKRKEDLIHAMNPHWNDLWEEVKNW